MENLQIWDDILVLDDEIKMKHLKVLYPLMQNWNSLNEIELVCKVVETLWISINWDKDKIKILDFIDNLTIENIEILATVIWKILDWLNGKKK